MEELLLTFNKNQYKKYLKIKDTSDIELNFDTSFPKINSSSLDSIKAESSKIYNECNKLLAIKSKQSVFITSLSRKEIESLIPVFYTVISKIDQSRRNLYEKSISIANNLQRNDKIYADIYEQYNDFLPYKAALSENEKYREKINAIDREFIESLILSKEQIDNESSNLLIITNICDVIIPSFFKEISQAADAPKFEYFDEKAFFLALSSFIEKIKI